MSRRLIPAALVAVCCVGFLATPAAATTNYTGTLADGATWTADVPGSFNGTIILFSHGFGPLVAQDAPDPTTQSDLLAQGYALVGSSYSGPSWWALNSAVDDQFGALAAVEKIIGRPQRAIAWGESMGGLVSAEEAQRTTGQIAGALTTCGLVAGAVNLNNYQLDGEYAIDELLADDSIQLVDYGNATQPLTAGAQLASAVSGAQGSAAGRARTALAAALLNAPTWNSGSTPPAPTDYAGQETQQAGLLSGFYFPFVTGGRYQIELSDGGGDSAFNVGVDYAALLRHSPYLREVAALYQEAGLNLGADLATLNTRESTHADPAALVTLVRTSMVTGRLAVPELDIHTTADQLVPVQQENWYARQVAMAGSSVLFRQAFVYASGHCNFTPADTITALHALEHRLDTGRWDDVTEPANLDAAAAASGLGTATYERFRPAALSGARTWP